MRGGGAMGERGGAGRNRAEGARPGGTPYSPRTRPSRGRGFYYACFGTSYDNLAEALMGQGKYAEAEAMHRRALAIRLKALGEGHPDTARSYNLSLIHI